MCCLQVKSCVFFSQLLGSNFLTITLGSLHPLDNQFVKYGCDSESALHISWPYVFRFNFRKKTASWHFYCMCKTTAKTKVKIVRSLLIEGFHGWANSEEGEYDHPPLWMCGTCAVKLSELIGLSVRLLAGATTLTWLQNPGGRQHNTAADTPTSSPTVKFCTGQGGGKRAVETFNPESWSYTNKPASTEFTVHAKHNQCGVQLHTAHSLDPPRSHV